MRSINATLIQHPDRRFAGKFCWPIDYDNFATTSLAADQFHLTSGYAKLFGEKVHQSGIGSAIDWRRGQPYLELVVMYPNYFVP